MADRDVESLAACFVVAARSTSPAAPRPSGARAAPDGAHSACAVRRPRDRLRASSLVWCESRAESSDPRPRRVLRSRGSPSSVRLPPFESGPGATAARRTEERFAALVRHASDSLSCSNPTRPCWLREPLDRAAPRLRAEVSSKGAPRARSSRRLAARTRVRLRGRAPGGDRAARVGASFTATARGARRERGDQPPRRAQRPRGSCFNTRDVSERTRIEPSSSWRVDAALASRA